MEYRYGSFSSSQIKEMKDSIRKQIFFLLLLADPETKNNYPNVDIFEAFNGLMYKIDGMNSLLFYPEEIVEIQSLLEEGKIQLQKEEFNFEIYRKLILDAGAKVLYIKEV